MKYEKQVMACQPVSVFKVDGGWWHKALNALLPPRCVLCGGPSGPVCICEGCKTDLPWLGPHCLRCALPLASPRDTICGVCIQRPPPYLRTVCPLEYGFPVNRLVQAFKFKRQLAAGRVLSRMLCEHIALKTPDLPGMLIPVPLHSLRMISRGFNQAYEMSAYTARVLDLPLNPNALRRMRRTRAQSGLSRKQRRRNLKGAFCWRGSKKPARHVALIDDVMTTGSTVTECARVLKKAGAKRVDVWVAARAV